MSLASAGALALVSPKKKGAHVLTIFARFFLILTMAETPRVIRHQAPVRLGFDCSVLQAIAEDQDIATS